MKDWGGRGRWCTLLNWPYCTSICHHQGWQFSGWLALEKGNTVHFLDPISPFCLEVCKKGEYFMILLIIILVLVCFEISVVDYHFADFRVKNKQKYVGTTVHVFLMTLYIYNAYFVWSEVECWFSSLVWNGVWEIAFSGVKKGQHLKVWVAHPTHPSLQDEGTKEGGGGDHNY